MGAAMSTSFSWDCDPNPDYPCHHRPANSMYSSLEEAFSTPHFLTAVDCHSRKPRVQRVFFASCDATGPATIVVGTQIESTVSSPHRVRSRDIESNVRIGSLKTSFRKLYITAEESYFPIEAHVDQTLGFETPTEQQTTFPETSVQEQLYITVEESNIPAEAHAELETSTEAQPEEDFVAVDTSLQEQLFITMEEIYFPDKGQVEPGTLSAESQIIDGKKLADVENSMVAIITLQTTDVGDGVAQAAEESYPTSFSFARESVGVPSSVTVVEDDVLEVGTEPLFVEEEVGAPKIIAPGNLGSAPLTAVGSQQPQAVIQIQSDEDALLRVSGASDISQFDEEKVIFSKIGIIGMRNVEPAAMLNVKDKELHVNSQEHVVMTIIHGDDDARLGVSDASDVSVLDENVIDSTINAVNKPVITFAIQDDAVLGVCDARSFKSEGDDARFDVKGDEALFSPFNNTVNKDGNFESIIASEGISQEVQVDSAAAPPIYCPILAERINVVDLKELSKTISEDDNSSDWVDEQLQNYSQSSKRRRVRFRKPRPTSTEAKRHDKLVTRVTQLGTMLLQSQTKSRTLAAQLEDVTQQLFNVMSALETKQKDIERYSTAMEQDSKIALSMEKNLSEMHETMVSMNEIVKDVDYRSRVDRDILTDLEQGKFHERIRETSIKVDKMVKLFYEMSAGDVNIDDKDMEKGYQGDFVDKMNAWSVKTSAIKTVDTAFPSAPFLNNSACVVDTSTQTLAVESSKAYASPKTLDAVAPRKAFEDPIPVASPITSVGNKKDSIASSSGVKPKPTTAAGGVSSPNVYTVRARRHSSVNTASVSPITSSIDATATNYNKTRRASTTPTVRTPTGSPSIISRATKAPKASAKPSPRWR